MVIQIFKLWVFLYVLLSFKLISFAVENRTMMKASAIMLAVIALFGFFIGADAGFPGTYEKSAFEMRQFSEFAVPITIWLFQLFLQIFFQSGPARKKICNNIQFLSWNSLVPSMNSFGSMQPHRFVTINQVIL